MHFGYKIWIEMGGMNVFGMGIYQLLFLVRRTGSLKKAAEELKMSYRAAWGKVRDYESRMGISLLEQGRHGRIGAHLTNEGETIVNHFQQILADLDDHVKTGPMDQFLKGIKHLKPPID
jgi:molybdate transport system regulatory protein